MPLVRLGRSRLSHHADPAVKVEDGPMDRDQGEDIEHGRSGRRSGPDPGSAAQLAETLEIRVPPLAARLTLRPLVAAELYPVFHVKHSP